MKKIKIIILTIAIISLFIISGCTKTNYDLSKYENKQMSYKGIVTEKGGMFYFTEELTKEKVQLYFIENHNQKPRPFVLEDFKINDITNKIPKSFPINVIVTGEYTYLDNKKIMLIIRYVFSSVTEVPEDIINPLNIIKILEDTLKRDIKLNHIVLYKKSSFDYLDENTKNNMNLDTSKYVWLIGFNEKPEFSIMEAIISLDGRVIKIGESLYQMRS